MVDSFNSRSTLTVGSNEYEIHRLDAVGREHDISRLPYSLKVLLENLLRLEDGETITRDDIVALATWNPTAPPNAEIAFTPARVLLQDFTGVPAIVDLAAMRDAMRDLGGDPSLINPLSPADLVIDHSVQVDEFRSRFALERNIEREYERNGERYAFLRWGQEAFRNFTVVPPGTGIVHQINLEYIAQVVFEGAAGASGLPQLYPDTLVGTDSHTTMINGLGVLGWGVGGIEAEAALLGQAISMLIPQVVGFELTGQLREGATATDLVLTVTEMLRSKGVVGRFVEFYGAGISNLPLADRATIGNMSPEFGSTCAIFPVDAETLRYLELSGRSPQKIEVIEAYLREQGLFHTADSPAPIFTDTLSLDLGDVVPSIAGPKRPQDRIPLTNVQTTYRGAISDMRGDASPVATATPTGLTDGAVVIAAITSCTNTSNPSVMIGAGLVARKARELGLMPKPWVKTSLAPGSKVVTRYLTESGLDADLDALGFQTVGYGCTTCIGNSGPLPQDIQRDVVEHDLVVASVLSGNRNFEGRINQDVKMNFLASPPLVVAYALVGHMDWDPETEPLGESSDGNPVYLRDIWPTQREISDAVARSVHSTMFRATYEEVFQGDDKWRALPTPAGDLFAWDDASTYARKPAYFDNLPQTPGPVHDIEGARCLVMVGDSVTTDHISPAGAIKPDSPAGQYLQERGVAIRDFNSYGSRRGNHEVMVRGTFANVRMRNQLAPGTEGCWTTWVPDSAYAEADGERMTIFDAAERYAANDVPLVVLAGKEYGSGSSRDWAAKGPRLLGVRAVIAESYERIHRSNLIGMGIAPLQFNGTTAESLGLTGFERFDFLGIERCLEGDNLADDRSVAVTATGANGKVVEFMTTLRIDTPQEARYYRHGGILQFVLRSLLSRQHTHSGV
jgi:aconitate hydratase